MNPLDSTSGNTRVKGSEEKPTVPSPPFLSAEDIERGKKILRRGDIDLGSGQAILRKLLKREKRTRETERLTLIEVGVCCFQACLRTIQRGRVSAAAEEFIRAGETTGDFFYRYLRAECGYRPSKATKMAAPLRRALLEGLSPTELRSQMRLGWTLEDGYEQARQAAAVLENGARLRSPEPQSGSDAQEEAKDRDDEDGEEADDDEEDEESESAEDDDENSDDDLPKPPKRRQNRRAIGRRAKSASKAAEEVPVPERVGAPSQLGSERTSLALVHYSLALRPMKIEYLSPNEAKQVAERYLRGRKSNAA